MVIGFLSSKLVWASIEKSSWLFFHSWKPKFMFAGLNSLKGCDCKIVPTNDETIASLLTVIKSWQDCCLIPEAPFYLEGQGGLFEFIEQRLKENGHIVIVLAEGAGQDYVAQSMHAVDEKDASGNRLLLDSGLWLTQKIKVPSRWFYVFPYSFLSVEIVVF